jgi:diguanylate cyclase (GGDEF)-like protein
MSVSILLFVIAALAAVVIILLLSLLRQSTGKSKEAVSSENIDRYLLIDPETGVYNQQFLYRKLEEEIYRASRYNSQFSFALFNFDDVLKDVEKERALTVLRKVVATASRDTRYSDFVARFETNGVAVIFTMTSKVSSEIPLNRLISKFKKVLEEENFSGEPAVQVYGFPEDKTQIEKLILKLKG